MSPRGLTALSGVSGHSPPVWFQSLDGLFFFFLNKEYFSPQTISNNMTSNSNLSNMRRLVEQLKLEASVERIKVSQAAAELQQYCLQNAGKDALLVGVPTGSNPFREPRSCAVV
uniref:Guanine nucleotide-binding protein subunit gamma n=1 Tax=Lates calcarifer TaxID=8187 RepID=A0A4W6C3B7_LATCA